MSVILLEDGSHLLLEDDTALLSEEDAVAAAAASSPTGNHFISLAVHDVRISWDKSASLIGWFVLNQSLLGGPDKLAPSSQLIPTFSNPYDDMTPFLLNAGWSRGRSATLEDVEQGKWSGAFRCPDGRFNPDNPSSPLYGSTNQPGRPIRHRSAKAGGAWYPEFFGYIRTMEYETSGRIGGILHVEADDLFVKLDLPAPVIPAMTNTTTGAIIGKILDSIGWSDPLYRSLAVGDTIASWPGIADGSSTPLQLISELLAAELGLFYIDGAGVAVYESRNGRSTKTISYTIGDGMVSHAPGVSLDKIGNKATSTRTGSTPQTYQDATSADPVFGFGPRPLPDVESPYFVSDNHALAHAQYRVNVRKNPAGNLWSLEIDNRTDALLQALLDIELSDRIQTTEGVTGAVFDGYVERIERSVEGWKDTATFVLSEKLAGQNAFILGSSLLSGSDVLTL